MSKQKDWLPHVRTLMLIMARVWENALAFKGGSWGIPNTVITALHDLINAAQDALDQASPALRTPVLTARVNAAFAALEAHITTIETAGGCRRFRASFKRIWGLFYRRFMSRVFFCELRAREQPAAAPKPPLKASCPAPVGYRIPLRRRFWVVTKIANPPAARST
ncbi:MAG: hypothetical protein LBD13_07790 [Spirochaetaceae bacterium]|jgi:hypothetical protein|nr:hypothetical protein [Spirochaetaceae bacterium]